MKQSPARYKSAIHEQPARIGKAVAGPRRLELRLAALPRDREVVAYCRGPYCVLAVEAVRLLRAHGFQALRLEDGVPDWRARGFDVVDTARAA